MRITSLDELPCWVFPYRNVDGQGNGVPTLLPVHRGIVDRLPENVDALICTADLQGFTFISDGRGGEEMLLLGQALPTMLQDLVEAELLPPLERCAALLAGDLFALPNKRGGYGDALPVWRAWGEACRWTAGVAGNHDLFENTPDGEIPSRKAIGQSDAYILNAKTVELDGIRIAGVSGCIGNPKRPFRFTEEDYQDSVFQMVAEHFDVLVMHDGPDMPHLGPGYKGSTAIREVLEMIHGPRLVVRGHADWPSLLGELRNGVQVLNVEARVVILTCEGAEG